MARFAEPQIAREAKFGIDLQDVRKLREFAARILIESARDEISGITARIGLAAIILIAVLAVARTVGAQIAIAPNLAGGVERRSGPNKNRIE